MPTWSWFAPDTPPEEPDLIPAESWRSNKQAAWDLLFSFKKSQLVEYRPHYGQYDHWLADFSHYW